MVGPHELLEDGAGEPVTEEVEDRRLLGRHVGSDVQEEAVGHAAERVVRVVRHEHDVEDVAEGGAPAVHGGFRLFWKAGGGASTGAGALHRADRRGGREAGDERAVRGKGKGRSFENEI